MTQDNSVVVRLIPLIEGRGFEYRRDRFFYNHNNRALAIEVDEQFSRQCIVVKGFVSGA